MTGLLSLALLHNAATLASGDVFRMNRVELLRIPLPRTSVNEGRGLPRYSPYLAIADLVDPFVEDDLVMPLAAVHEVLPTREPFVIERVDLVISISPYQRVVAVIAIQGVVALAAVKAVLPVGTVRIVPVIVTAHHIVSGTAVDGVVAEVAE